MLWNSNKDANKTFFVIDDACLTPFLTCAVTCCTTNGHNKACRFDTEGLYQFSGCVTQLFHGPGLPNFGLVEQDSEPTASHNLKIGTNFQYQICMLYYVHLLYKR